MEKPVNQEWKDTHIFPSLDEDRLSMWRSQKHIFTFDGKYCDRSFTNEVPIVQEIGENK